MGWWLCFGRMDIKMKKAWIENGRVRDVSPGNPEECYTAEVAKFYDTDVPDEANNGDFFENGVWSPAPVYVPPAIEPEPSAEVI